MSFIFQIFISKFFLTNITLLRIHKNFSCNFFMKFAAVSIMLFFYASKWRHCRHWEIWWYIFAYFCCRRIFRIIFTFINLFDYKCKICINKNVDLLDFWYWLNSNILMSSEGIISLQKCFFLRSFLCNSSFSFVAKEWRQFKR